MKRKPTLEELKESLDYNLETGIFTWRYVDRFVRGRSRCTSRYAGKKAGSTGAKGRISISSGEWKAFAHHLAWFYHYGTYPNKHIDHINMDQSDNRICNLRLVTRSQNQCNRGVQSNNTSGYKGVSFSKSHEKWHAYIKINRKRRHIGLFNCPTAAYIAYCKAARELHGQYARLA